MNSYTSCRVYLINKPRVGSLPSKISFGSFPFLKSGSLAAPRRPVKYHDATTVKSVERGGQNGRYCFSLLEQSNGPFLYSDVVYSPQRQSRLFPLPPQQQTTTTLPLPPPTTTPTTTQQFHHLFFGQCQRQRARRFLSPPLLFSPHLQP